MKLHVSKRLYLAPPLSASCPSQPIEVATNLIYLHQRYHSQNHHSTFPQLALSLLKLMSWPQPYPTQIIHLRFIYPSLNFQTIAASTFSLDSNNLLHTYESSYCQVLLTRCDLLQYLANKNLSQSVPPVLTILQKWYTMTHHRR